MKSPWIPVLMLVAAGVAVAGCGGGGEEEEQAAATPAEETLTTVATAAEVGPLNFTISGECQAVIEINELSVVRGQQVTYCNKWAQSATLTFSAAGFLPNGDVSVTLSPGQCLTYTIDNTVPLGTGVNWTLNCQGYSGPGGGGPVKVQDPPPPPPGP